MKTCKRYISVVAALTLLVAITGCSKVENRIPPVGPEPTVIATPVPKDQGDDVSNEDTDDKSDSENSRLLTEIISPSNLSGNLANMGLASFDSKTKLHYLSIGSGIYSFDPENDELTKIASVGNSGRATYLNFTNDWFYYVNTYDQKLYRVNRSNASQTELFADTECYYAVRYQSYILYIAKNDMYADRQIFSLFLKDETSQDARVSLNSVDHISFQSQFMYHYRTGTNELYLSNYDGRGQVAVFRLKDIADELHQAIAYHLTQDYSTHIVLTFTKDNIKALYLYKGTGHLQGDLLKITEGNVQNVNYAGSKIYFTMESAGQSAIYRLDPDTLEYESIMNTGGSIHDLQIINHWIYYRTSDSTSLYQLRPGETQAVPLAEK